MFLVPNNIKIAIIIPVYNEDAPVLLSVLERLQQLNAAIIVIDDGSQPRIQIPAAHNRFVLHHAVNLGQGAALQTGFDFAKNLNIDYIVTFDADDQHNADDIPALLEPLLKNEADITLGSRFLEKTDTNIPPGRRRALKMARFINNIITGVPLTDVHNGLRAMNKTALQNIQLKENRMAHATEIINEIKRNKLLYKEVPVHISYSGYSRKKGQNLFSGIRIFFDLLLHKLFE